MTHASPCAIFDNAVTPLPKGKLATLVTYLALEPVVHPKPVEREHDLHFEQVTGQDYARYRAIFRQVGAPWLWFSRLKMAQAEVMAILDDPANRAFIVTRGGLDIGLCEVDCRNTQEAELAYLGLVPQACGQGFGRIMMDHAVDCVIAHKIGRMIVHTCQMDDPRAVGFYRSCGFVPYQLALEVMDDPRAIGLYPAECAPQIPLLPA
jgi:ribosomal protein S18 acetylase RimI-like enzyme